MELAKSFDINPQPLEAYNRRSDKSLFLQLPLAEAPTEH